MSWQLPQSFADLARNDHVDGHASRRTIEEYLIVAVLILREPLPFERRSIEDGESRLPHEQRQHAHTLRAMLVVVAASVFVLVRRSDDLLEFFGQEVIGRHDILERIHRILRRRSFATQKAKKECIRSCLPCVVTSPLFQVEWNSVRSTGPIRSIWTTSRASQKGRIYALEKRP